MLIKKIKKKIEEDFCGKLQIDLMLKISNGNENKKLKFGLL